MIIAKIKKYFALRRARKRFVILGQAIDCIDKAFVKKGVSRRERRRFWHNFISSPEKRKDFMQKMKI